MILDILRIGNIWNEEKRCSIVSESKQETTNHYLISRESIAGSKKSPMRLMKNVVQCFALVLLALLIPTLAIYHISKF